MFECTSIGRNILIIDKYFKLYFKNALKEFDLNTAEGMALLALFSQEGKIDSDTLDAMRRENCGKTQDQIIDELHYDKSVMTRTMQSLEKKGYVSRSENPNDSRSYIFTVTDQATQFKPTLIDILRAWNDLLLKDIAHEDIIRNAVKIMSRNAQNAVLGGNV